jgi:hypothetical protein
VRITVWRGPRETILEAESRCTLGTVNYLRGEMLFFPVVNGLCAGDGLDFAGELACATQNVAALGNVNVEVDGAETGRSMLL